MKHILMPFVIEKWRFFLCYFCFIVCVVSASAQATSSNDLPDLSKLNKEFKFLENKGQLSSYYNLSVKGIGDVSYYTKAFNGTAFFGSTGVAFGFIKGTVEKDVTIGFHYNFLNANNSVAKGNEKNGPELNIIGKTINTSIQSYNNILYSELYKGIDLKYHLKDGALKFDYIVSPNADPNQIQLKYSDVEGLRVNTQGELEVLTQWGVLKDHKPYSYQLINGKEIPVDVQFVVQDDVVSFKVGDYNKAYELIIDPPTVEWSTYLTSANADNGYILDMAVGDDQSIYITGWAGNSMPATNLIGSVTRNEDVFIYKLSADGTTLDYATILVSTTSGTPGATANTGEAGFGIDVNAAGEAFVGGTTHSTDFPVTDGSTNSGNRDIFALRLNAAGSALTYSTLYGGTESEAAYDVAVFNDQLYLTGYANSTTLATGGVYDNTFGGGNQDAFLCRFSAAGNLDFFTYYGGAGLDFCKSMDVDANGDVYIYGTTESAADIASVGAFDVTNNNTTVSFIAKLSGDGTTRIYGTYFESLGGPVFSGSVKVNDNNEAFISGVSAGNVPVLNPYQATSAGSYDVYVAAFNPTGTGLLFSTLIGGAGADGGKGSIHIYDVHPNQYWRNTGLDVNDSMFVVTFSVTDATGLDTQDPLSYASANYGGNLNGSGISGGNDSYVGLYKYNPAYTAAPITREFSTYLGGALGNDYPTGGVRFVNPDCGYCFAVGIASHSSDFPTTTGVFNPVGNGTDDEATVTLICDISLTPEVDDLADADSCDQYTLPTITGTNLTGNEGYYTLTGGKGTRYNAGDIITADQTLFIFDSTSTIPACFDEETFDIDIHTTPTVNDIVNADSCDQYTLPIITGSDLTGNEDYYTLIGGKGTRFNAGDVITDDVTLFIFDSTSSTPSCFDEETFGINIHNTPTINTVTPTDPTECGVDDGTITIAATGADGILEYSIDGGTTYQSSNSFTGLSAADSPFEIRVRYDDPRCEVSDSDVTLTAPQSPVITTVTPTDPTECGVDDGSITITATGADGTLEYSIDGGTTYQSSNSFTGLSAADSPFEIRVRYDDPRCEVSDADVTLTAPQSPVITTVTPVNPTECGVDDGSITITATGASGTLEYSIDGGTTYQASNSFTGLSAADSPFEIRVRYDDPRCEVSDSDVTLTAPQSPVITTVTPTDPTECGVDDGTITITAIGASGTLEYSIDGGTTYQTSNSFTGLSAVDSPYEIRVRYDDPRCEVSDADVTLTAPQSPVITTVAPTNPTECGVDDGSITITATGASGTLEYSIDGGTSYQSSNSFTGLSAANSPFEIRVRYDDPRCEVSDADVTLTAPQSPVITTVAPTNPTECGVDDGSITITATGASGTLEYSIDGGTTYQASNSFTGLSAADSPFEIRVRYDDPRCEVSDADVTLTAPQSPVITTVAPTNPTECGVDDGSITMTATGASGTLEYSIDGGTSYQSSNSFTGLSAATSPFEIRVRYDDSRCEVSDSDITLTAPQSPLITTVTPTDPTDCGVDDGTITITATGASGTLEYSIDGGTSYQSSNSFTGLSAADSPFEIRVRYDDPRCEVSDSDVTLTAPQSPVITTVAPTNPTDCGVDDGTITITATGASGTLEYSIDGGTSYQSSNSFIGLSAANSPFEIRVRYDDPRCEVSDSDVMLTAPQSPLITTVTPTDPTDCGVDDGTITITATGASGTLEYSIDGGTSYQSSNSFTGLSAADSPFEIRVRYDDPRCEVSDSDITLTAPQSPVITAVTPTDPIDCGVDDGSITITATGASGTLEYSIDGGATYQASNSFTGLSAAGSPYEIRVRYDEPRCEVSDADVTLIALLSPVVTSAVPVNPTACGVDDGTITINATGASGSLEYSIDGGTTYQVSNSFTGLAAGSPFEIRVRYDDPRCEVSSADINLAAPQSPVITSVVPSNPTECGVDDGSITISATGASGTLEYSIDGGTTYQASNSFTGLSAVDSPFEIRVRYDDPRCEVSDTDVTLIAPESPVITAVTPTDPTECGVDDGTITITATGASGTLEYSIDGGTTYQASNSFTGLSSVNSPFEIRVRYDDPRCEVSDADVTLIAPESPVITAVTPTDPTECGVDDGTITIAATGASGMLEYSVNGGTTYQASNGFIGLSAVDSPYQIRVRYDDPKCEVSDSDVTLTAPQSPVISSVVPTNPTACGVDDGSVTITAAGVSGTLEYSIDGGTTYQASNSFTGLSAVGSPYEIRVRYDDPRCEVSDADVILAAPQSPVISLVVPTNPTECGVDDGTITITATGASGTLEYSIDGGTTYQASNSFTGLSVVGSPYEIRVRYDDPRCEVSDADVILTAPESPVIVSVVPTDPTNCNVNDATIAVDATGASGTLEYSIDGGTSYQSSSSFTGLSASASPFEIRVRYDDPRCEVSDGNVILVAPEFPIILAIDQSDPTSCGVDDGMISINATGVNDALEYSIDGGVSFQVSNTFTGLAVGNYSIDIQYQNKSCPIDSSALLNNLSGTPFSVVGTSPLCDGSEGYLTLQGLSNSESYSFIYSVGGANENVNLTNEGNDVKIPVVTVGSYSGFSLTNSNNCVTTSADVVIINEAIDTCATPTFQIDIPNALTPNGDGYNDLFYIVNIELFPDNILRIYNRWGDLVYKEDGYINDWEGTYNGKLLPTGTYYYVLDLRDGSDEYKGYVMILE